MAGWASTIVIGAIGFLMIPFLLGEMGEIKYSLVLVLVAVVGIAQLVDLGIGISLARELSASLAKGSDSQFKGFLCSGIAIYLSVGLAGSLVIYLLSPTIVSMMWEGGAPPQSAIQACRIYGMGLLVIGFFNQSWISLITAYERFDLTSLVVAGSSMSSAFFHWVLIPGAQDKVMTWVLVQVGVQLAASIVLVGMARKLHGALKLKFSFVSWEWSREILGLSSKVSLLKLTTLFSEKADPIILASYSSPVSLVMYNAASRVSAATRPFVSLIAGQLCPRATEVFVKGDMKDVRQILTVGTRYTMMIGGLIFLLVVLFAHPFSNLWLGGKLPDHWNTVANLMIGLAIIEFMTLSAGGTQWSVLFGMKKLNFLVITMLPTAILNLGLSIWLVGYKEQGVMGVIFATIVIAFVRRPILVWYTSSLVGLSAKEYFLRSYAIPLLILGLIGGLGAVMRRFWTPDTWIELVLSASVISALWVVGTLCFGVSNEEKVRFWSWIGRVRKRLAGTC